MCGIAGILGCLSPGNREALQRMSAAMAHRGPDSSGAWESEPDGSGRGLLLAHRRLAILDLSPSGAQPMTDPVTGDTLAVNGEVYNYRQLRAELEAGGQAFRSSGDSAVMLRALALRGPGAASSFRGMFAYAFWNRRERSLSLCRDALGIKPLYLCRNPDPGGSWSIAFASELRALLSGGLIQSPRLNPDAVASMVWNGFTVMPDMAVSGVDSLWPGETRSYRADGSELRRERHWSLPQACSAPELDEEGLAAGLEECVRLHLASDVPLGVFLSGGVDSSAVANLAQRGSNRQVSTFTLAFQEDARNEGPQARAIAQAIGTDHRELVLTQDYFLSRLDRALDSLDQPSFDGLNSYFMSCAVREAGFTVALVGSGGDELFGGYSSFSELPSLHRFSRRTRWIPLEMKMALAKAVASYRAKNADFPPQTRWAKLPDIVSVKGDLLALYQLAYALFLPSYQDKLLAVRPSAPRFSGLPAAFAERLRAETAGRSLLEAVAIMEQRLFLGERLLRDTDAVSMASSLEIRLPLVDQELLSLVNRLPERLRFHPLRRKALLRRVGLRGLSPALFDRPKSGFELPYAEWMLGALGRTIDDAFHDRAAVLAAGLEPAAVIRLWEAFKAGSPGLYWSRVWALYVLVRWARRNKVSA